MKKLQKRYVVVAPDTKTITAKIIEKMGGSDIKWLSDKKAAEFIAPSDFKKKFDDSETAADLFSFPLSAVNRKRTFLFCDMDSTILKGETFDEIAPLLNKKVAQNLSDLTKETMEGKLNFDESIKRRVTYLRDIPAVKMTAQAGEMGLSDGATALIKTMKRNGAYCVLVSGGFSLITKKIALRLGFDENHGNHLVTKENILTGELSGKLLNGDEKGLIVKRVLQRFNAAREQAIAVGDGSNDVRMAQETGLSFAYHGKEILKEKTDLHINHTDLRSILYAQGYSDADIVE